MSRKRTSSALSNLSQQELQGTDGHVGKELEHFENYLLENIERTAPWIIEEETFGRQSGGSPSVKETLPILAVPRMENGESSMEGMFVELFANDNCHGSTRYDALSKSAAIRQSSTLETSSVSGLERLTKAWEVSEPELKTEWTVNVSKELFGNNMSLGKPLCDQGEDCVVVGTDHALTKEALNSEATQGQLALLRFQDGKLVDSTTWFLGEQGKKDSVSVVARIKSARVEH